MKREGERDRTSVEKKEEQDGYEIDARITYMTRGRIRRELGFT